MTKKAHREEHRRDRANLKRGNDHLLDQKTDADLGRDDNGRARKGLAGISDPRDSDLVKYWTWELQGDLGLYQELSQTSSVDVPDACKKAKLTGRQTEAVLMFCEGLSLQQIAVEVGIARESVHDRLVGARKKMRAYFNRTPLDTLSPNTPQ